MLADRRGRRDGESGGCDLPKTSRARATDQTRPISESEIYNQSPLNTHQLIISLTRPRLIDPITISTTQPQHTQPSSNPTDRLSLITPRATRWLTHPRGSGSPPSSELNTQDPTPTRASSALPSPIQPSTRTLASRLTTLSGSSVSRVCWPRSSDRSTSAPGREEGAPN